MTNNDPYYMSYNNIENGISFHHVMEGLHGDESSWGRFDCLEKDESTVISREGIEVSSSSLYLAFEKLNLQQPLLI